MLGQDVVRRLDAVGLAHVDSDLECDITNAETVRSYARNRTIKWIMNCSAYTAVDKAEDEESKAYAINAIGPANLGRTAVEVGARVIHVSTDYVFDGEASSPYTEDELPSPRGAYGRTKARGEELLADATLEHFIVRTAWLYGVRGQNFVYTMLRLMDTREEITVVDDQRGCPTYTRDLAAALCAIVVANSSCYGIYHYTNEGETTWFQFARKIYELGTSYGQIRRSCEVRPITTNRYPTKSARPKYSVLSKAKISRTFAVVVPTWQDGLERFFRELKEGEKPT
jgi:dTDP-4-dehydrorhamnose reductase